MGTQDRGLKRWTKLNSADQRKRATVTLWNIRDTRQKIHLFIHFRSAFSELGGPKRSGFDVKHQTFSVRGQSKMILSYEDVKRGFHYPPPKQNSVCNMKIIFHFIWCFLFGYIVAMRNIHWLYGYSIAFTWLNKENPKYNFKNFLVMYLDVLA